VRYRLEYILIVLIGAVVRLMPLTMVRACGGAFGRLVSHIDRSHRRIAMDNLARAFPSRSPRECRAICGATFAHFGSLLFELIKFSTLDRDEMLARVEVQGEEHLRQAYERGHGLVFVTGHFGYWEIQAIAYALHTRPISLLARPVNNPYLHAMLERIRCRTGNTVIYRQGGLRKVLRKLGQNEGVAIPIDQHLHSDTVYVDFFGRPAATTSAVAAIALRTGAMLVPVFAMPLPGGRYRLIYDRPVQLPPGDAPDPIAELTQRCTDVLEMYVRRDPHLWLWMHRRWRDPVAAASPVDADA
jgi:KDO2-lipid IV(A) lauroyltransferase